MKKSRRLLKDMDMTLLIVTLILFIIGLLNIVNASSQAVVLRYGTGIYHYFLHHLLSLFIGLIAFIFIINVPTKKYHNGLFTFIYLGELGLLMYLYMFGKSYLGSVNWIKIAGFSLQPSELAKPIMIIAVSLLFEKFCSRLRNNKKYTRSDHYKMIGIIILIGALYPGLVFLQKDLGTTIILVGIFSVLFLTSPIQASEKFQTILAVIVALIIGAFVLSIKSNGNLLSEEQKSRLDFYDPCSSYEEGGYQTCNGFIAINSGGLFGVGIGNSKQVSYLPESHTDSVFAIFAEEFGFIGGTIIIVLYLIVLYRIFDLASHVTEIRNKYICLGIGTYIFIHIFINLGGLFGMMPLTGVPLPFLSYGGTYTITLICSLAIVQRIHIEKRREKM